MAAKRRKKKRKGATSPGVLRWLAIPVGLGLVVLAGYLLLSDGSDSAAARSRRPPVASPPNRQPVRPAPPLPTQSPPPVVISPGSHDRDHIGEDSRRRLLEILESDGEPEEGRQ